MSRIWQSGQLPPQSPEIDRKPQSREMEVTVEQIEQALPLEYRKGAKVIVKKLGPLFQRKKQ
jgi:hypothetical protein